MTDFGSEKIRQKDPYPHLGASTEEVEENCAIMAAHQMWTILKRQYRKQCKLLKFPRQRKMPPADYSSEMRRSLTLRLYSGEKISAAANKEYAVA